MIKYREIDPFNIIRSLDAECEKCGFVGIVNCFIDLDRDGNPKNPDDLLYHKCPECGYDL